jgi:hypothetical protein
MSISKKTLPTSALWEQIFKASSAEEIYSRHDNGCVLPSFSEYISTLCKQRGEVPERIIKKANIERAFGHAIFRGDRNPSRNTVLQLAFGFDADVDLTQSLLKHAGHSALYPRVPRDAVIGYCLYHHFSFIDTQHILSELDLPLIGGSVK